MNNEWGVRRSADQIRCDQQTNPLAVVKVCPAVSKSATKHRELVQRKDPRKQLDIYSKNNDCSLFADANLAKVIDAWVDLSHEIRKALIKMISQYFMFRRSQHPIHQREPTTVFAP